MTLHENAASTIIDEAHILHTLAAAHAPDDRELDEILMKALELHGLDLYEAAVLLQADREQRQRVYAVAKRVKEAIYGARMVLFAPLYTSNYCVNDCLYCSFRRSNAALPRKHLSREEIAVTENQLTVAGLDALDGSPILDIKLDRPREGAS